LKAFEDLGVSPELTEALASEGIETPTPLQEDAVPVIRQGNNLIMNAGPGSGMLVAWLVPVLERIEAAAEGPKALALCATSAIADRLAESSARIGAGSGHAVAALGASWVLPERADVLFATPADVLDAVAAGTVSLTAVETLVLDQAHLLDGLGALEGVERVLDYIPEGGQRILSALPMTPAVQNLAERAFKRTMTLPAPAGDVPDRGEVRFRIAPEPREAAALSVVAELFADGARHVLVFCRNEDRAADVGDYFTLHGFAAGLPGDESAPVWLGVDALEARAAAKDVQGVVVLSCDAPADPDTLDRRHSVGSNGVVIVLPRELAHLKNLGKRTGYDTIPFPPPARPTTAIDRLRSLVERAIREEDTAPYLLALEPLFERHDPAEVAAAAVALLRRRDTVPPESVENPSPLRVGAGASATSTPAWAKLFVGVGERDGLRKGDLVGAITGETGIPGEAVGKIEIRESHSLVEVHDTVARKVIQAINGTTIRGRAVRADFDRPRKAAPPARKGRPKP
jgi:ATP-dependent RNA helicase DeaD